MSKSAIKVTETLMLRRIDPVVVLSKYLEGQYKSTTIPKTKVPLSSAFINLTQKIGTDSSSKVYRFNDKTNSGQIIVTTNHDNFQSVNESNTETKRKFCRWSRREILDEGIGIPIAMEIDKVTNKIIFYEEDKFYNFSCAMAGLKRIYSCYHSYKDPLYMDAEQLLHLKYYKMYPDREGTRITEALDSRLLDINGGPLSDEEYDSDQCNYVPIPNVVIIPIKRQYIKLILPTKK